MLPEISLNILDIAQNSITAEASLVRILVREDTRQHRLTVHIGDDGRGMNETQLASVTDPFFTSRTTRKVGLGIPFFKEEAECTGGSFFITSRVGVGTEVEAVFCTDSIDCMPLGDICATIHELVTMNEQLDFCYEYEIDGRAFTLDTRELREILGDVSFTEREVSTFIQQYLYENTQEVRQGNVTD